MKTARHSLTASPVHRLHVRRVPEYDVIVGYYGPVRDETRVPNGEYRRIYYRGGDQRG